MPPVSSLLIVLTAAILERDRGADIADGRGICFASKRMDTYINMSINELLTGWKEAGCKQRQVRLVYGGTFQGPQLRHGHCSSRLGPCCSVRWSVQGPSAVNFLVTSPGVDSDSSITHRQSPLARDDNSMAAYRSYAAALALPIMDERGV
jgi:hypothetical protein